MEKLVYNSLIIQLYIMSIYIPIFKNGRRAKASLLHASTVARASYAVFLRWRLCDCAIVRLCDCAIVRSCNRVIVRLCDRAIVRSCDRVIV